MDSSFASGSWSCSAIEPPLTLLGSVKVPTEAHLLPGCMNPKMDVVLLFRAEAPLAGSAASSAATGAAQPPMSAAAARLREMVARKQQQKAAAGGTGQGSAGTGLIKSQPIKASLWRIGEETTIVWEVNLPRPDMFASTDGLQTADVNEDCSIRGLAWSPDGRRVAINLLFKRTWQRTASTSESPDAGGKALYVSAVILLATETGALLKCIKLSEWADLANAPLPKHTEMSWVANNTSQADLSGDENHSEQNAFSINPITILRSLTPLPPLAELTSYGLGMNESGKANGPKLLPHQLRFRQMAMGRGGAVKAEQGVLPSIAAKQWQYEEDKSRAAAVLALARLPVLPIDAVQWGIVESATGQEGPFATVGEGSEGDTDALLADVLLCSDGRGRLHLLAQGTARLGEVTIPNEQTKHRSLSTAISRDFSSLSVLASGPFSDGKEEMVLLTAKLHLRSSSQMLGSTPAHLHLLALSTTLHHLLSYLLDTLHLMRQVFRMTYIGQVADEWLKHAQEVGEKYRCDFQLECITAIAGGRLGDGIEVMIMSMINESALHMMEDTTYTSLRFLRRAAATVIGPACERILIILESLRAHGLLPAERDGAAFPLASETEALVQELLRASLVIEVEAEKDLLAAGEFYKWWKQERDKHENPRRDDGQFHPIIHDTLAAIEYVQRGFINPHLDALLGTRNACNVVEELRAKQVVATPAAQPTGLEEILRRTEQRLSDASVFNPALVVPLSGQCEGFTPSQHLFSGALGEPKCSPAPAFRGTAWALASAAAAQVADTLERRISSSVDDTHLATRWRAEVPTLKIKGQPQVAALASKATALPSAYDEGSASVHGWRSNRAGSDTHRILIHRPDDSGAEDQDGHIITMLGVPLSTSTDQKHKVLCGKDDKLEYTTFKVLAQTQDGQKMRVREVFVMDEEEDLLLLLLHSEADENTSFSGRSVDMLGTIARKDMDWRRVAHLPDALSLHAAAIVTAATAHGDGIKTTTLLLQPEVQKLPREARPVREMAVSRTRQSLGFVSGIEQEYRLSVYAL